MLDKCKTWFMQRYYALLPKLDKRQLKWFKQRLARGFDDRDTWSLDQTLAAYIWPRLEVLRDKHVGCPYDKDLDRWMEPEEWTAKLADMTYAFKSVAEQFDKDFSPTDDAHHDRVNRGIELFAKYFHNLWW